MANKNIATGIKRIIIYKRASFAKRIWPWSNAQSLINKAIRNEIKPPGIKNDIRINLK